MDTRLLSAYLTVMDVGSVTRAATELGYTQPGISAQLAALERQLGARLFDRGSLPLQATPFGRRIYPHARATVLLVNDLMALARLQE